MACPHRPHVNRADYPALVSSLPACAELPLCGKWAVKTLTSPLSWNSKHAVLSGTAPVIVNTLFSSSGLTDGVLYSSAFLTGSLPKVLWHWRNVRSARVGFIAKHHLESDRDRLDVRRCFAGLELLYVPFPPSPRPRPIAVFL